jgi:hypothetical protein
VRVATDSADDRNREQSPTADEPRLRHARSVRRAHSPWEESMPQNIVGTGGADTLTLGDTSAGVHTVNGLNGDDSVLADAGSVTGAVVLIDGEGASIPSWR